MGVGEEKWYDRLKQEREAKGLTQAEVAEAVGTNEFTVSRWEKGKAKPSPLFRRKLADLYQKSIEELGLIPSPKETTHPDAARPPEDTVQEEQKEESHKQERPLTPGSLSAAPIAPPPRPAHLPLWVGKRLALVVLTVALLLGFVLTFLALYPTKEHDIQATCSVPQAAASPGTAAFASSGQFTANSNQGMSDEVVLDLQHLPVPAAGKSYYGWLSANANSSEPSWLPLGPLMNSNGKASLRYSNPHHANLLATYSYFLITEDSTAIPPLQPAPDSRAWKYQATICQTPYPNDPDHYSLLNHLQHLLSADPHLEKLGIAGGLDSWLYRNSQAVMTATQQAEAAWQHHQVSALHTQLTTILAYLDGSDYLAQDLPPSTPLPSTRVATRLGLLYGTVDNNPAGYLEHIAIHLEGVMRSPGASVYEQNLAAQILNVLRPVSLLFTYVHTVTSHLSTLTDKQLLLHTTLPLLQQQAQQAQEAFTGQTPSAATPSRQGITWIFRTIQQLASFELTPYQAGGFAIPNEAKAVVVRAMW